MHRLALGLHRFTSPWVWLVGITGIVGACASEDEPVGSGGSSGKGSAGSATGGTAGRSGAIAGRGGGSGEVGEAGDGGMVAAGGSKAGRGGKGGQANAGAAGDAPGKAGRHSSAGSNGESGAGGSGPSAGAAGDETGGVGGHGGEGTVPRAAPSLRAQGNQLVDAEGTPVQLRGVNRSGTEYACVGGWGFFDGETDDASLDAIAAWKANAVRIPLNEHCWLGVNGVPESHSGAAYQNAIAAYAARIVARGMTPILELHWSAPGTTLADGQWPMPDSDHTPTFWSQVATRFGGDSRIIFELFNEPYPDDNQGGIDAWTCWRDGGTCSAATYNQAGTPIEPYDVAGMQALVDAVRGTGAENVILVGGVRYSNDLSGWLAHAPVDPLNNLGAAWHAYSTNLCVTRACLEAYVDPVARVVPVVTTEFGEFDSVESPYTGDFLRFVTSFLDERGAGYLAWTWNTWGNDLALIGDYDGTPFGQYGIDYREHLRSVSPGGGGEGGAGGTGGTGGTGSTPEPLECNPIASPGLVADFTYQGGPTDNAPFGDAGMLSGGEYVFPPDTGGSFGLTTDVTGDDWHLTGRVEQPPSYSGFGFYFVSSDLCTKVDASAYGGVEFELGSNASTPTSITFSIGTAADEVSAEWLNEYVASAPPVSGFGRCIPTGFPPEQYDGTCRAPSVTIPLAAGPLTTVSLRFEDFMGGLPAAAIDPSEITGIGWTLPDGSYDLDLVIDDFRFVP